jgi:hypothetical protein
MIRSVVFCIFASYLASILLLLGFLLPMMAKSCRLVVFLLLLLRREKGCLSIWNAKKQHPPPVVRLAKIYATHVPKKKMRLMHAPSISCCCFPLSFFHSVFFLVSFSRTLHPLLPYYYYPIHVMMLTRIRNPCCCVVLYDYIIAVFRKEKINITRIYAVLFK